MDLFSIIGDYGAICTLSHLCKEQFTIFTQSDVLQILALWLSDQLHLVVRFISFKSVCERLRINFLLSIPLFLSIAHLTPVSSFGVLTQTTPSSVRPKKDHPLMVPHAEMGRYRHSAFNADMSWWVRLTRFLCVYVFALFSSPLSTVLKATVCGWLQTS